MGLGLENIQGGYTGTPPDARPRTLEEIAQEFLDVVGADREIDPHEFEVISGFLQSLEQLGLARAARAAGQGAMPDAQQPMGQTGDPNQLSDYGTGGGNTDRPGFDDQIE